MLSKKLLVTALAAFSFPLLGCSGKPASTPTPTASPAAQASAAPTRAPEATPTADPAKEQARGLIRKGMDKVLLGQATDSLQVLQQAYQLDPENGEADYWLMKAYDLTEDSHSPSAPGYAHARRVLEKMKGTSHAQEAQDYVAAADLNSSSEPAPAATPTAGKTPKPGGKATPKPLPKPTKSAAPPSDVTGFEKAQFGVGQADVATAFGASFRPYQGPKLSLQNCECYSIGRRNVGRYPFEVVLGFSVDTTALKQVLLTRLWTTPASYDEYQALVDWAIQQYGQPHGVEDRPNPPMRSVNWEFPSAKIRVKMEREISLTIEGNS